MICLQMNIEQRQALLQQLGLKSEFFGSVLVRTEALLKKSRYQRGLNLVRNALDVSDYRSVLDYLLAVISPSWNERIRAFYRGEVGRIVLTEEWATIDALDQVLEHAVRELAALYAAYCSLGWREGHAAPEFDDLTVSGVRMFLQPRVPVADPVSVARTRQAA